MEKVKDKSITLLLTNIKIECINNYVTFDILDTEWEAFTCVIKEILYLRYKDIDYYAVIDNVVQDAMEEIILLRKYHLNFNLKVLLKHLNTLSRYGIKRNDIVLIDEYIQELTSWGKVIDMSDFMKRK